MCLFSRKQYMSSNNKQMYITELSPIFYFISVHQEYEIHQGLSHFKIDYLSE